jgi:hypothetical protein
MNRILVNLVICAGLLGMSSCKGGDSGDAQLTVAPAAVNEQPDTVGPELTPEINSARSAAMVVATMPMVVDPATRVEIQLQAALFGEAIRASKARYVLLLLPEEDALPSMGISQREFRLRVLAELASTPAIVAWSTSNSSAATQRVFLGTREAAATVRARVLNRDAMAATVIAEWSVEHTDGGGMRQGVSAAWDGRVWAIEAENARLEW